MLTKRLPLALALTLALLIGITTCAQCLAGTPAQQGSGQQARVQQASGEETRGEKLIERMSKFYAGLTSLSYSVGISSTVKHANAPEKKHTANYEIRLAKPLSLAVDITRGKNEDKTLGRLDENDFVAYVPPKGYYKMKASDVPVFARINTDLASITSKELALFGFLGVVCAPDPIEIMKQCRPLNTGKIRFVGSEKIAGGSAQHLELVSDPVVGLQWDVWIMDGEKPWVSRTSTRMNNPKNPVSALITTNFSNWKDNPKLAGAAFKFVPPNGAKQLQGPGDQGAAPAAQLTGKAAPTFKLATIDGRSFNLAASKGKEVVVLDFWATWCPPCREALPILAEVTSKYAGKGVRFCAIDQREDAAKVKEYLKAQGLKINCALDSDGNVAKSYGVRGIPQSVIIGKDGKIKVVHIGFSEDLEKSLPKELDAVLAGHDPGP